MQLFSCPTLYTLRQLPPPKEEPKAYPVPDARTIATFIENIRQRARLTPQSLVITLIYVDRLEARSEGVLLHARSWRPIVFASLLLASKVRGTTLPPTTAPPHLPRHHSALALACLAYPAPSQLATYGG